LQRLLDLTRPVGESRRIGRAVEEVVVALSTKVLIWLSLAPNGLTRKG
jgi:hypothetical protein